MILEIGKMKYRAENLKIKGGKASADVETFRDGKWQKEDRAQIIRLVAENARKRGMK